MIKHDLFDYFWKFPLGLDMFRHTHVVRMSRKGKHVRGKHRDVFDKAIQKCESTTVLDAILISHSWREVMYWNSDAVMIVTW